MFGRRNGRRHLPVGNGRQLCHGMFAMKKWKQKIRTLKQDVYAVYLACKDPRVPRHVQILALIIVGYAFSPIDLIPDFIPVLGYLDDMILIPLGIALLIKMIPPAVMQDCREKAGKTLNRKKPRNWWAGAVIIVFWIAAFVGLIYVAYDFFDG